MAPIQGFTFTLVHFNQLNVKEVAWLCECFDHTCSRDDLAPAACGAFNCGDEQEVIMKKARALHIRCQHAVWRGRK